MRQEEESWAASGSLAIGYINPSSTAYQPALYRGLWEEEELVRTFVLGEGIEYHARKSVSAEKEWPDIFIYVHTLINPDDRASICPYRLEASLQTMIFAPIHHWAKEGLF